MWALVSTFALLPSSLILSAALTARSGPLLTANKAWNLLSPSVETLPTDARREIMKASLIAFISLNDQSDANGDAQILTSIRHARTAARHWSKGWDASERSADASLTASQQVEHVTSVLLHDAVAAGRLSPEDPERVLCFGERTARRVRLTAVRGCQHDFHAAVRQALSRGDGWAAARLLEARGDLLRDAEDLSLCREAKGWCDDATCPELRALLCSTLRATERRHGPQRAAAPAAVRPQQRTGAVRPPSALGRVGRASAGVVRVPPASCVMMERPEEVECDVVIVGGGPAGCTCALYTSRANLKTVMLDKNPATGALAITSHIANYPGVDTTMSGEELLTLMREQAIAYGTDYRRAQVFLVEVEGEIKSVYTPEATYKARSLVLATGAMGRPPSFKGEDTYLGKGVSYCATCDGAFYEGSEVAVVGSNAEAVEEAQFLTKFASTVHWVTAGPDPKPEDAHAQQLLASPNVKHWSQTKMEHIDGDVSGVTGVTLRQKANKDGPPTQLPVEGVFIYVAGSKPITDFLEGQQVALTEDGGVQVDGEMATNAPGVFAIGDIRNTPYKQVVVAASDGCIAAMSIDRYLKGRKHVRVDWIHK